MPIRYYPLTRILSNRYTRGNEFILSNGKPYTGRYYTTYTGQSFTGIDPILGNNEPLFPVNSSPVSFRGTGNRNPTLIKQYVGSNLPADIVAEDLTPLSELVPYYPVPLPEDYQRGYFKRYFAKRLGGAEYIFEISKIDWTKIQNGEVEQTALGYETAEIFWQLTGPLRDTRVSQYQVKGGVLDTNKRVTEAEDKTFRGLVNFIGGDYTKFARITP